MPILYEPVLWYPAVSSNYLLVSTVVDWPAKSIYNTGVLIWLPASSYTTGTIDTPAKVVMGLVVDESK